MEHEFIRLFAVWAVVLLHLGFTVMVLAFMWTLAGDIWTGD